MNYNTLIAAQTNWMTEGPSLFDEKTVTDSNQKIPSHADFHSLYSVVFVDPTGYLNLAANVSTNTYLEVFKIIFLSSLEIL